MSLHLIDVGELATFINEEVGVYLVGAGVSGVGPTHLPDAPTWAREVLNSVAERAPRSIGSLLANDDAMDLLLGRQELTGRMLVSLEAVLQRLDDECQGRGSLIAADVATTGAPPNYLHKVIGHAARSGAGRVLTTNFDCAIEIAAGVHLRTWTPDIPWDPSAAILKLHGTADRPTSLRHSFRSINQPFGESVIANMRELTSGPIIALGYSWSDFDVVDTVAPDGEPIYWLNPGGVSSVPPLLMKLSRHRSVLVMPGLFDDLIEALGGGRPGYGSDVIALRSAIAKLLESLKPHDACRVMDPLLYQAAVADSAAATIDDRFVDALKLDRQSRSVLYHVARSLRLQARSGGLLRFLAAGHSLVAFMRDRSRPIYLSDAAARAENVIFGFLPGLRRLGRSAHQFAADRSKELDRSHALIRLAVSEAARYRHNRAIDLLHEAINEAQHDPYLEGTALRRLALSYAVLGNPAWPDLLAKATQRFEFESRAAEVASVERTRAACLFMSGDAAGALEAVRNSRQIESGRGQSVGLVRSRAVEFAIARAPTLAHRWMRRA